MTGQPNTRSRTHGEMLYGWKAIMAWTGLKWDQVQRLTRVEGFPIWFHEVRGRMTSCTTKGMITRWFENRLNHQAMSEAEHEVLAGWVDKTRDGEVAELMAVIAELRKRRLMTDAGMKDYDSVRLQQWKAGNRAWKKERHQKIVDATYDIVSRDLDHVR